MAQICDKNSTLHKQISIFQIMHAGDDQSSHNKRYFKKVNHIMKDILYKQISIF